MNIKRKFNNLLVYLLCFVLGFGTIYAYSLPAFAQEDTSIEEDKDFVSDENSGNYSYPDDEKNSTIYSLSLAEKENDCVVRESTISEDMCFSSYWEDLTLGDASRVLMSSEQINTLNQNILGTPETHTRDLTIMPEICDADYLRQELSETEIPEDDIYVNTVLCDNKDEYFDRMKTGIVDSGWTGTEHEVLYGVGVKNSLLLIWPTTDFIGYSATDTDNEVVESSLRVNEPMVIQQYCKIGDQIFYWGYTDTSSGWILGDNIAICEDKDSWLDAWKTDLNGNDFLVVIKDKVVLEVSDYTPWSSDLKLTLGTVLKLVPEEEIPEKIADRSVLHNYVVYLPTRDVDGKYVREMALIPEHESISIGYLPMTQSNILKIAFSCLGDRYGWGNMADALDCSGYSRVIYSCFGLSMPRNTSEQVRMPGVTVDLSEMDDLTKERLIETFPAGTILYMRGHVILLTGSENGTNYAISAAGMFSDSQGELDYKTVMNVVVSPLTVRSSTGTTFLNKITAAIIPSGLMNLADAVVTVNHNWQTGSFDVKVTYEGRELMENINYAVTPIEDPVTGIVTLNFTGIHNFIGSNFAVLDPAAPCSEHSVVIDPEVPATCTDAGLTEGQHCSDCGTIILPQEIIPATGHDWEEKYTVDRVSSASQDGIMSIHCKNCSAVKNQTVIPAYGNKSQSNTITKGTTGVATGDGSQVMRWLLCLLIALSFIIAISWISRKRSIR